MMLDEGMETQTNDNTPTYPIRAVDSALKLLLLICQRQQIRVAEASDELDVARSTAHRLMQMLQLHGFVRQDSESKVYLAGPVLFEMGLQIVRNLDIRSHARPFLESTLRDCEETVQLFALQHDGELACIEAVESPRPVRVGARVGVMASPFASAPGRAVMSVMPAERVEGLMGRLPSSGPFASKQAMLRELRATRKRGYAVDHGDADSGVTGIAAPIMNERGESSFAVTIALPSHRFVAGDEARLGEMAASCARAISAALPW